MINIDEIRAEIESGELTPTEPSTSEGTTAYGVWKVTTEVFRQLGIVRETPLTSQYVYNILKNREPKGTKMSGRRYNEAEVEALVRMFVKRNLQYRVTE